MHACEFVLLGVLLPQTKYYLYVEKGDYGVLRCQNKNGSPITDAQWYRIFPNGTKQQFGNSTSDPVYVQSYILNFRPSVRQEDQGVYYCCKPNGSCNENFTVTIAGTHTCIHSYIIHTHIHIYVAIYITLIAMYIHIIYAQ